MRYFRAVVPLFAATALIMLTLPASQAWAGQCGSCGKSSSSDCAAPCQHHAAPCGAPDCHSCYEHTQACQCGECGGDAGAPIPPEGSLTGVVLPDTWFSPVDLRCCPRARYKIRPTHAEFELLCQPKCQCCQPTCTKCSSGPCNCCGKPDCTDCASGCLDVRDTWE